MVYMNFNCPWAHGWEHKGRKLPHDIGASMPSNHPLERGSHVTVQGRFMPWGIPRTDGCIIYIYYTILDTCVVLEGLLCG